MQTPAGTVYRFGPFEVNAASGELLKQGKRIKLQEQPFRLLVILLENPGEVVTREQIQGRIWEANTFVDFDSSLRVAVRKLREALGDDAENPHYIETIPKRGYRFLGPAPARTDALHLRRAMQAAESSDWPRRSRKWVFAGIIFLLVAIVAGTFLFLFRRPRSVLTAKDTVVLADFANSTGDPVFDGTLRQGMAVQLEQSPFLSLISEERIQEVLRRMGQPADARLTPEIAREICERTASAAVLDGSIASLGSQYVLGLRAKDCRTGDVLAEEQVQAARKEDVLHAMSRIASKFRTRLGESLATVEKHDTPLEDATTPSLQALKAYSMGERLASSTGQGAALPFFQRAVEIDDKFAIAYAALALAYGNTGESGLAAQSITKAYELRDRASDKENFFIAAYYDGRATGNQEKAEQICEAWAQTYPREVIPHLFLSGFIYPVLGKFEKGLEEAQKAVALDPEFAAGYLLLSANYVYLDRLAEAKGALQKASDRRLEIPDYLVQRYDIAFLDGDQSAMDREVTLAQGNSGAEDWIAQHQAFVMAYHGRLQPAQRMSARAMDLAQHAAHRERAALFQTGAALWQAFSGDASDAKRSATAALQLASDREVEYGAALALALSGDSVRSQNLLNHLAKEYPEDTSVQFSYLPTLRAILALNHRKPSKAIELLQVAGPYELGAPRSTFQGFFGALYPIYVRGQAYLAAHQGAKAAAEFQKVLDHRGIVVSDPVGALARLQFGRAQVIMGDKAAARKSYQDFLTLWKDADPDIPIYRQAKAEYARLQ